jgi:type IX secretion system PorP/SprF family membrane protein
LSVVCVFFPTHYITAQYYYYSQYEQTPLNINPALLSTEKDIKLSLLYHQNELWKDLNMKNFQMSLIYPLSLVKNERIPQRIGLSINYDNTGKRGLINCTGGSLAFTQGVTINRWSVLSAGLQASFFFYNNSNPGNYTTGSQWVNGTGFDPSQGIAENINFETVKLFTVNTGINWNITDGSKPKGNLGVSVYYLNKPIYSFLNENNKLDSKYIIHGNYRLFKINSLSISPRMLLVYQNVNIISFGTLFNYSFKSDNPFLAIRDCNLQLGLDYRYDHSGIMSFSIEQTKYIFGISYTMGLNSNKVYSNYGSNIEICFALKFHKNRKRTGNPNEYNIGETRLIFNKGVDNVNNGENNKQNNINNYRSDTVVVTGEKYHVQLRQDFKFKFNDATLTSDAQLYLDDLAKMLKQNQDLKVEVIGHTDDVGTEDANLKISGQRAKIVIDYLVSKGIKQTRLKLTAKGKSEPLVSNNNEDNKAKNRRVEFIIYSE